MKLFALFCVASIASSAVGFGNHGNQPSNPHHMHQQRPGPRYYGDLPPHIIASPRPRSLHPRSVPHPQYRTLNPQFQHPSQQPQRNPRSDPHPQSLQKQPQLVASASNTPVLVLKKDHSRPILSSAVVAAAIAEKRAQQAQAEKHENKPIPTVIMQRPGSAPQQQSPPQQQPQQQVEERQEEKQQEEQKPEAKSQEKESHMSLEQDELSEEAPSPLPPNASAERRSFFDSMSHTSAMAHQVSGPQGPSNPRKQVQHARVASASSMQQTRAAPQQQHRPHHPSHHHDLEDDDEPIERITRSNSNNPYGAGEQFQYPPPQGNYIAQGPTRVPVKYQQGVIGIKPQHHGQDQRGHPQQQRGQPRPYKQRVQQQPGSEEPLSEELEEEEEEAQPDRLQELLATSKFTCGGKKDGYYADDSLNCEVFHYCQDGGKHSWLCPNGFAFHQIHLICVPPSSDNICKQSSNYHFVNEYLYKPINEREAESTNASLKYADRYFPDGYNHGAGDVLLPYHNSEEEETDRPVRTQQHAQQQQPPHNPYANIPQSRPRPQPTHQQSYNPYAQSQSRPQSHYSAPSSHGGFQPSQQVLQPRHPHQQPRVHPQYAQQRSGSTLPQLPPQKPHHHKGHQKPHPQASSPVFYSPETINIPLNQRRPIPTNHHHPQIFRPSPQVHKNAAVVAPPAAQAKDSSRRKFEDEYEEY